MKAVIYARYSSDSQREESIEGQLRECHAYAEKNGITVLSTYIDRALSAKTDNRPEFQRMMKDSSKHLFDIVIVWKLDRFSRNRYDSAHNKAILRKNGVKVTSATESISEDATGILLESMLEGYAEFYSAELSEKVIRGMTENALKGKYNGGSVPLGFRVDSEQYFQPDPLTAPIVKEMFQRYADGDTMKGIKEWLYEKGARSSRGKPIGLDAVKHMLKNRRYIGEYQYRDIVQPDAIPRIVDDILFERVQLRMEKNKKAPARFKTKEDGGYLLTTKLFCGLCGSFLVGESGTSRNKTVHHYYKCVSAKNRKGCKKKTVRKEWLENLVVEETLAMLMDDATMERIADMVLELQAKENTTLPLLKKQLKSVEQRIENILEAIQQGVFTSSTKEKLEALEDEKGGLEVSIIQEEIREPLLTREQILFWLHRFRGIDKEDMHQRQQLIDCFVNGIFLYEDRIVLTFNHKDTAKPLTIQDIDGSSVRALSAPCD